MLEKMQAACDPVHYFPIDISYKMLKETTDNLRSKFPKISTVGIPMDYQSGIEEANKIITENRNGNIPQKKLVVFLGSSIGNFEPKQSISLLRILRQRMSPKDYLLVGFDMQKKAEILNSAYNDKQGVTAEFNLNLLVRINKELGGRFPITQFVHRAFYNKRLHRVEMHLVSSVDQDVNINSINRSFNFKKNETIHTENSYKYSMHQISQMAKQSGLAVQANFMDKEKWFALSLLRPATAEG